MTLPRAEKLLANWPDWASACLHGPCANARVGVPPEVSQSAVTLNGIAGSVANPTGRCCAAGFFWFGLAS